MPTSTRWRPAPSGYCRARSPRRPSGWPKASSRASWLGDDFVGHYVEMKRSECEAHMQAVTDWEIARYLEAL